MATRRTYVVRDQFHEWGMFYNLAKAKERAKKLADLEEDVFFVEDVTNWLATRGAKPAELEYTAHPKTPPVGSWR